MTDDAPTTAGTPGTAHRPDDAVANRPADGPDAAHLPPPGVDRPTVDAVGAVTAALEVVEHARGMLYGFHRTIGQADLELGEALDALEDAGHGDLAHAVREDLLGRNAAPGRWTFQIVEEFDEEYWQVFRDWERRVREQLVAGRQHVYEARLKEERRTHGRSGHEARPPAEG